MHHLKVIIQKKPHLIRNYTCWCYCQCNEWWSINGLFPNSSNKLKLFLLSEVSKLIDSVMTMRQEDQRCTGFLEKKEFDKITKVNSLLAKIQKYLTNWWIVLWSNRFTSFTRNFFISQNVQHKMQKKTLELRKENKKEVASQKEYS